MPALNITSILGTDAISASRVTINNNFRALKDAVESLQGSVDSDAGTLAATSLELTRGSLPDSTVTLSCDASASVGGDLDVGGALTAGTATLASGATVSGGNVDLTSSSGRLQVAGAAVLQGSLVMSDFSDSYIAASSAASPGYSSVASNVGTLELSNKSAVSLDFSAWDGAGNVVDTVKLPALAAPQRVGLVFKKHSSHAVQVAYNNILEMANTESLRVDQDYAYLEVQWAGTGYVITAMRGLTKV